MFYQYKHFGTPEYFCKEYGENFSFPLHLHNSFEFITVFSGEMQIQVEQRVYIVGAGESVLVFPNQLHSLYSSDSKHMLCIFSPELVKAFSSKVSNLIPTDNKMPAERMLIEALDNFLSETSIIEKKGLLYLLCAQFDKKAEYKQITNPCNHLLYKVFEFVEENYTKDCSLSRLSSITGYSYSYISRYFKTVAGISFNSYVNKYRLSQACYLLQNTECTILQCALESGYKSLRSFNRNFIASFGITPSEYQKKQISTIMH